VPEESKVFITANIILRVFAALGNEVLHPRAPCWGGISADKPKHPKLGGRWHGQLPDISPASVCLTPGESACDSGHPWEYFLAFSYLTWWFLVFFHAGTLSKQSLWDSVSVLCLQLPKVLNYLKFPLNLKGIQRY